MGVVRSCGWKMTVREREAAPAIERRSFHGDINARRAAEVRFIADTLSETGKQLPPEARARLEQVVMDMHAEARALEA